MEVIKEKLVEWSRKVESIEKFSKFFCIVLLIVFAGTVLSDIGILSIYGYLCWKLLIILLILGSWLYITKTVLNAVKKNEENKVIYKNSLICILLSDKNVIEAIFILLMAILVLCRVALILITVSLLLYAFAPNKIAKYFDEKLLK